MRSRRVVVFLLAALAVPGASAGGADAAAAKDPRNFSWVHEGVLAVGGGGLTEEDVEWLHGAGFLAIADFRIEHSDPAAFIASKNMTFFDMPIDAAADINATQFAAFVEWAREQRAAGRPVYIHCTNGWHRAAAFAVAWDMAENGKSYEQAARDAAQRRAGTTMRAVAGLLDYEAMLAGKPQLAVVLVSPLSHPGLNATMPARVEVFAEGAPAANATVLVWGEESKLRIEGTTDANGVFAFEYRSPKDAFMDHLFARASLPGHRDGADNVEFIFQQPARSRGPLDVSAERTSEGLLVRATSSGRDISVRVVAHAPGWTSFEASAESAVLFPDAPMDAVVEVRVVAWGSEGGVASVPAIAPPPTQAPPPATEGPPVTETPPAAAPGTEAPPAEVPPPDETAGGEVVPGPVERPEAAPAPAVPAEHADPRGLALYYAAAALAGAIALGVYVVVSYRRAGVGNE